MSSSSLKSKFGNLLYLQGLNGPIFYEDLVDNGVSIRFMDYKIFNLLRKNANKAKRFVVTLGDESECCTQVSLMLLFAWDQILRFL